MTVASQVDESELEALEHGHLCFGDFATREMDVKSEIFIKMKRAAGSTDY